MIRGNVRLVAVLVALAGLVSAGRAQSAVDAVRAELDGVLAKVPQKTTVGLVVADAAGGTRWYERNPDTPLKPASLQKLFVTAAALERFGPKFEFVTRVYQQGDELWIVGAGDPAVGDERLCARYEQARNHFFDRCAQALREHDTPALGKVVLDDSIFDREGRHPDWPDDQADRWYQAPAGGLNLNDNCLDVLVVVNAGGVTVKLEPALPKRLVVGQIKKGDKQRPILRRRPGEDVFELSGTVRQGGELPSVSAYRPTVFFGYALHEALEQRGIDVRGAVVRRKLSVEELGRATLLFEQRTRLADVLWRCNKFSQNLFAECLLKALAAYDPDGSRSGTPGSWDHGRQVLIRTLERLGVDLAGASFRDGCGLSHENRATAAQIARVLTVMRSHVQGKVFVASLAEPGRAGSMRRRYRDPALEGRLRAKTGTINGVRCLAGYVTRPDDTVLIFALLINGSAEAELPTQVAKALLGGS